MKGELESVTKAKLKKLLTAGGNYQFWPVQAGYGASTVDCIACCKGQFYAIECKRQGVTKPSPRQRNVMAEMRKAGAQTWLVTLDEEGDLVWLRQQDQALPLAPVAGASSAAASGSRQSRRRSSTR